MRIRVPFRAALFLGAASLCLSPNPRAAAAETNTPAIPVQAITPPRNPIPPEDESADVTRFSFVVYGDTRGRRDGQQLQYEHSLMMDSVQATITNLQKTPYPVRFVLQTGDAVVNGRDPRQWNSSFVALINRVTTEAGIPYFLAPGNHDVTAAESLTATNRLEGLRNYLSAMDRLIPPDGAARRLKGYPTYAFAYGNSFFLALDSNIASDATQLRWVRRQLEGLDRNRFRHVFAFFHHPPFSSGPHGGAIVEPPAAALRKSYMPLFRKHHVDAIFAGHEHLFEHWVERYQDAAGRKWRLDEIVTGGGGAPLYGFQGEPDTRDYIKSNAAEKVQLEHLARPLLEPGATPYHFVLVRVDGDHLQLEVIGIDWGRNFKPYRSNKAVLSDTEG
jgi:hypothetical protein